MMIKRFCGIIVLILIFSSKSLYGQDNQSCTDDLPFGLSANFVHDIDLSNDNRNLAIAHTSGVYIYEADTLSEPSLLYCRESRYDPIYPIRWSSNNELIATYNEDDGIGIWDLEQNEILYYLRTPDDDRIFTDTGELTSATRVHSMEWSPDGRYIASAGDIPLRVWDIETQEIIFEAELMRDGWSAQPSFLAWSPDGRQLAFANYTELIVWDTATWDIARTLVLNRARLGYVISIDWSQENLLAVAGDNLYLQIWDTETWGEIQSEIPAYVLAWQVNSPILAVTKAPTNRRTTYSNIQIDIIDTEEFTTLQSLVGHNANVINLQWFEDGSRLISLDTTGIVYLWDVETGEVIAELVPENN